MKRGLKWIAAAAVGCMAFAVYRMTLAPSVGYIDSGELAAVAHTLGIAHPTGYPLYTIIGRFFSMIPVADEVIVRLNLLSAILTATAAVFFFTVMVELQHDAKRPVSVEIVAASVISSLSLAFSRTFWLQGVNAEVYSLHLLLIAVILFCFVRSVRSQESRWWLAFAFFTGLAFTNHMTTVLLAPALLYWFVAEHGWNTNTFRKMSALSVPFLAGLSVYLFLPVRASQHPLLNWGNPQSFETFWWHITGKQFRVWMFSSGDVARKQFDYFFGNLPNEFHIGLLIAALIGAGTLLFSDRRKFTVLILLFAGCIAYSVNYDIHDIDSYFLLAFIAVAFFSAFGMAFIIRRFKNRSSSIAAGAVLSGMFLAQLAGNWNAADQRGNHMAEDYTKAILNGLPQNAIVISSQWDYFVSASYYYQHVEKVRTDVVVLDKELFRRSWYFPQLERMYPDVMKRSRVETGQFKEELYKFEHDLPYNYNAIEGRYTDLLGSFIAKSGSSPVYVSSEIESQYTSGYQRIPEGFLFRLLGDTAYHPAEPPQLPVRRFTGKDSYSTALSLLMTNALLYRASYEQFYGKDSLSAIYRKKASEITAKPPAQVSIF